MESLNKLECLVKLAEDGDVSAVYDHKQLSVIDWYWEDFTDKVRKHKGELYIQSIPQVLGGLVSNFKRVATLPENYQHFIFTQAFTQMAEEKAAQMFFLKCWEHYGLVRSEKVNTDDPDWNNSRSYDIKNRLQVLMTVDEDLEVHFYPKDAVHIFLFEEMAWLGKHEGILSKKYQKDKIKEFRKLPTSAQAMYRASLPAQVLLDEPALGL